MTQQERQEQGLRKLRGIAGDRVGSPLGDRNEIAPDMRGYIVEFIAGNILSRPGLDPKTSVTDASGRFHDIGNLYASDGSLFPTSSGYNPTMTIVALALRVGAAMVNEKSPLSALAPL